MKGGKRAGWGLGSTPHHQQHLACEVAEVHPQHQAGCSTPWYSRRRQTFAVTKHRPRTRFSENVVQLSMFGDSIAMALICQAPCHLTGIVTQPSTSKALRWAFDSS